MGPVQDLLFLEELCFRLTFQDISESCHLETFLVRSGTRRDILRDLHDFNVDLFLNLIITFEAHLLLL